MKACMYRYLAVRSQFPVHSRAGQTAPMAQGSFERSPLEKNPVQPASLRRHHLYATPVSRRSLMLAGRGKQALQEGQAWQTKVRGHCSWCYCSSQKEHMVTRNTAALLGRSTQCEPSQPDAGSQGQAGFTSRASLANFLVPILGRVVSATCKICA